MILTPVPVSLEQGSPEWHAWRETGIGSSDVATILGLSPPSWGTIDSLWMEKLGRQERRQQTSAMKRGTDLEAEARFQFEWRMGMTFSPLCFTTVEYPFLKASLDGWNAGLIFENKCPGKTSHTKYLKKGPPDMYVAQMQYQMAVSSGVKAYFTSYNPDFPEEQQFVVWEVDRDQDYIDKMLPKVLAFWRCLEQGIEPLEGMLTQSVNGVYAAF